MRDIFIPQPSKEDPDDRRPCRCEYRWADGRRQDHLEVDEDRVSQLKVGLVFLKSIFVPIIYCWLYLIYKFKPVYCQAPECYSYLKYFHSRYAHDTPLPVSRLIADFGNKMQICTQVPAFCLDHRCHLTVITTHWSFLTPDPPLASVTASAPTAWACWSPATTTWGRTSTRPVPPLTTTVSTDSWTCRNVLPDCRAMAIGARSQAARTYLEKFITELK